MKKIYLDHAATTPVDKRVLKAMQPYFSDKFGNASSAHLFGDEAQQAVEDARKKVANFLGCQSAETVFTAGATEADNLAIMGMIFGHSRPEKKLHIITTEFEHPAVLGPCKHLADINMAEISYVKPEKDGVVRAAAIEKEIKDNTLLVSIMYVNNEIGTIQPIQEIGEMVRRINTTRAKKIYFHTDAVQAANYLSLKVEKLGVDLLSLSGHKIYGPKGIGFLYVKKGVPLNPIQFGGHHEKGLRPGTLNVSGIVGLGRAVELIGARHNPAIKNLRDYCWQKIQNNITGVKLNGSLEKRIPSNLNISIKGVEGEALLLDLSLKGIAISTGSACSSGSLEPSHVLMSIGLTHEAAHGSLRITLGQGNNQKEIDKMIEILAASTVKFRKIAP